MNYDPTKHHRRSVRLRGYDYSQPGMYFVTVNVQDHRCVLGDVVDGCARLFSIGRFVKECWEEIPQHFENVRLDRYVVMPSHFHGILFVTDKTGRVGFIDETRPTGGLINQTLTRSGRPGWPLMSQPGVSLGKIVRAFKAKSARLVHGAGHSEFRWQRGFYEHIIRDGNDLDRIREYILENPMNWRVKQPYPRNIKMDPVNRGDIDWSPLD